MKNFGINEFVCRCGCCAKADGGGLKADVKANIEALVAEVLDPVREAYGKPIYVNSGYRCEKHNAAVGGVPRSQHLVGEAADIYGTDNQQLARLIVAQGRFDQLILYPSFLHVSYKRNGANRHKILRKTTTGYAMVSLGEML